MSLSDRAVQRRLRKGFICSFLNLEGDPLAGSSFSHDPKDAAPGVSRGLGEHNVQLLMLTPDGRLLNALAGYVAPALLREELDFARDLLKVTRKLDAREAREYVTRLQGRRARDLASREREGLLASFASKRDREDHEFVARNPLMPARDFRMGDMVGRAKTFFGSSTSTSGNGKTGNVDLERLLERIREKRRGKGSGDADGQSPGKGKKKKGRRVVL